MALAIVTATAKEMKAILAAPGLCPDRPRPLPPAEGVWSQASLAGRDCYLLVTGIGIINAAWALGRLAGKADDIEGVVNFGVAGSFDLDLLPLGAAAAVACEIWPEYGLANENGIDPRGLGFALGKESEKTPVWDRINLAPQTAAQAMSLELPAGLSQSASLTVSAVTGAPELGRGLYERYRAGMENMEGFALALGCLHARLPFLEVRTVSNLVGARPPQNWDLKLALLELGRWAGRLLTTSPSQ